MQSPATTEPPNTPPSVIFDEYADGCPFKNGTYADVLTHEDGDLYSCGYDTVNDETTHYYTAGDVTYEYRYDSSGNKTLLFERLPNKRIQYNYDTAGNVIKQYVDEYDPSEKQDSYTIYDSAGKLIRHARYNFTGDQSEGRGVKHYDSQGNLTSREEYEYSSDGATVYYYDAAGNLIEAVPFDPSGNMIG